MTIWQELAHSEIVRSLDEQRATVDTLQTRAGVLLAAGAIVSVGLGQLAFDGEVGLPLPALSIIGIVAAAVSFVALLRLAWPQSYKFHMPAVQILDKAKAYDLPEQELLPAIVRAMEKIRVGNEKQLTKLRCFAQIAVVGLAVNAITWATVALAEGR